MTNGSSITGIQFHLDNAVVSKGENTKFMGTVTLVAHFDSEDLWKSVIQRLNGLMIHKGGDIQSELIEVLQGRVDLLEEELEERGVEDRARAQRAEQAASLAGADKVRAEQHVSLLTAQLQMKTRELADAQNSVAEAHKANQAWKDWHDAHQRICHSYY